MPRCRHTHTLVLDPFHAHVTVVMYHMTYERWIMEVKQLLGSKVGDYLKYQFQPLQKIKFRIAEWLRSSTSNLTLCNEAVAMT